MKLTDFQKETIGHELHYNIRKGMEDAMEHALLGSQITDMGCGEVTLVMPVEHYQALVGLAAGTDSLSDILTEIIIGLVRYGTESLVTHLER